MGEATFREIMRQGDTWRETLASLDQGIGQEELDTLKNASCIYFTGCGSSYYLALAAQAIWQWTVGRLARGLPCSEVFTFGELFFPKTEGVDHRQELVVFSRSGKTTEAVMAAEAFRTLGLGKIVAISCYPESALVAGADMAVTTPAAREESTVMTSSFTSMLLTIQALAARITSNARMRDELKAIPDVFDLDIKAVCALIEEVISRGDLEKFVCLGSGPFYGIACEGMLKVKEMALAHSEAYHVLEFRHGPMSIVDEKTLIVLFSSVRGRAYEARLASEMRRLGARVLLVTAGSEPGGDDADYIVRFRRPFDEAVLPTLYAPVGQLLGFYQAVRKGLDPDHPRNLNQVVTL